VTSDQSANPPRLRLVVAYDGRSYGGWQSQPNADTVQDRIEAAIEKVAKRPIRIHGAGRTDAGVHALGQVAHFDPPPEFRMTPENWRAALNTKLPSTIRIMEAEAVSSDFHARFSATGKHYRYRICTLQVLPPFDAGLAWHLPGALDTGLLESALRRFEGRHDFRAFAASRGNETPETDFHRTIHEIRIERDESGLSIHFRGDGFLYKMIRMLVGTAVAVAQSRIPHGEIERLLASPAPRERTRHCAPAGGLTLMKVEYETARSKS
jgi:tRNA pseudouridine38-40 synthase